MKTVQSLEISPVFQGILDYFPSGVSLIDKDLNLVAWNREFLRLLQFPDALFVGKPTMYALFRYNAERGDYGPGDPEELAQASLARCRLMQAHVFERTTRSGMVLEVRGTPLPDGGFVSIYTDITQRKQAEIQYRATLENASVGIIFTRDRKVQHCNPKGAEIFGWDSPEDLIGQLGSVFWVSNEFYAEVGKAAGPILGSGGTYSIETTLRRKDGSTFLGTLLAKSVNPADTTAGTIWIAEDVTEKRQVEQAIKESERQLSQIVDGTPVPTFVIDIAHRVTHWNRACENLTGVPAAEIIGKAGVGAAFYRVERPTMADLVVDQKPESEIAQHFQNNFSRSAVIDGAFEAENFFPGLQGHDRWLYLTAAPLIDSQGRVSGAIETLRDMTSRREAEKMLEERTEALQSALAELGQVIENLQKTQDELVRSEKLAALGSIVAGVAHELNTPIGNSVMVASHLVEENRKFADAMKAGLRKSVLEEYLAANTQGADLMLRNLNKAAELVSGFKQVAVDQTSSQRRKFDLATMVAEVVTTLRPMIRNTRHSVEQSIPDGIELESFPGPLGQILTNLINNAILHGLEGREGGRILIEAALAESGELVTLKVSDNGKGIPANILPRIFDPFFTTRLGSGGSGLGLNIAHNMVTGILGGRIVAESEVGQGTTFTLTLPLVATNLEEARTKNEDGAFS